MTVWIKVLLVKMELKGYSYANRDPELMNVAPYWRNILKITVETKNTTIFHEMVHLSRFSKKLMCCGILVWGGIKSLGNYSHMSTPFYCLLSSSMMPYNNGRNKIKVNKTLKTSYLRKKKKKKTSHLSKHIFLVPPCTLLHDFKYNSKTQKPNYPS